MIIKKRSNHTKLDKIIRRVALYSSLIFILGHGVAILDQTQDYAAGQVLGATTEQTDIQNQINLIKELRLLSNYRNTAQSIGVPTEKFTEELVSLKQKVADGNLDDARTQIIEFEKNLSQAVTAHFTDLDNQKKEVEKKADEASKEAEAQKTKAVTLAANLQTESQARKDAERMAQELVEEIESMRVQHEKDLADMLSFTRILERDTYSTYERKPIKVKNTEYWVDVVTIDLSNPNLRILTDTATDDQCVGACPTKSVMSYVNDNKGFAGISGSYFCPASYSSCTETPGLFPHAIYNSRNGKYFNGGSGSAMIVFDKDKGVHFLDYDVTPLTKLALDNKIGKEAVAAIANFPQLTKNGKINDFGFLLDYKQREVKTRQAIIGKSGNNIKLVTTRSATVPDMAEIAENLEISDSLLLDGGSSTTLIYKGSHKIGPGRDMPTAIIFGD